jgi:hypothetical protein
MLLRMTMMVGVLAGTASIARAGGTQPAKPSGTQQEGVIDPRADAALRRMSDYLGGLETFRVDTTSVDEKITTEGQKIQEVKQQRVAVQRPGKLRIDRVGPNGHAVFRTDGRCFSFYNSDKNVYAVGAAPPTLDAVVDHARDRLHIDAPAGDLLVPDSYDALLDGVTVGRYVGLEPIGSVNAHHLAMTEKNVDYQIWIQDGPEPVPLRYVITSKDMPGQPQFTIDLRNWQPNAPISEDTFAFSAPAGARRIQLAAPQTATR